MRCHLSQSGLPPADTSAESDDSFKGYASGNDEPGKGFGHIAVTVDNLDAAVKRFDELGVKFKKRPEEGRMRVSRSRACRMGGLFSV